MDQATIEQTIDEVMLAAATELKRRLLLDPSPAPTGTAGELVTEEPEIQFVERHDEPWQYRWPDGTWVTYNETAAYSVAVGSGQRRIEVGRTESEVWGRRRRRAVVFGQEGVGQSAQIYPWVEFVEGDNGLYGAIIPNPDRPRAALKDGELLPERFRDADVRRSDELFTTIAEGPSLRLVVAPDDDRAMVAHACWVAHLRGRDR